MRKKGRIKYILVIFICFSIFTYGFIKVNITKTKGERQKSKFTIDLKYKPFDLRIETKDYAFYVNNKVLDDMKAKCRDVYDEVISK
ncbi:hypothetical protein [Clostridium tagluense]|uniref:Uncharacterized protein n=1 Tax=Clostridium tagluense TaxID=360422 RepID=A0A401UHS0_9CLOT|nr:hypothetical protein [Clostridium tagluense]GCD09103.1 hypothetical protein Ctaglu_07260 [Clostridium tagluense]